MSIRDNLKLVKENLTEEEMVEACRIACLDDFIESLPNKYDTISLNPCQLLSWSGNIFHEVVI